MDAASAIVLANAIGVVPNPNARPYGMVFSAAIASTGAVGTAYGPISGVVPTDRDFVVTRIACGLRVATTGRLYLAGNSYPSDGTSYDGQPDPAFTLQVRDSGSQGTGLFDSAVDARLIANNVPGNPPDLVKPWLFKAGNTITVEGALLKAANSLALTLSVVLLGYADYSLPSSKPGWRVR